MLMIEISPPFQWKPTIFRGKTGMISRVMWGWFAVAYTPMDFNEFIEQTAQAALEIADKKKRGALPILMATYCPFCGVKYSD